VFGKNFLPLQGEILITTKKYFAIMHKRKNLHKKLFLLLFFAVTVFTTNAQNTLRDRLEKHVFTLASDSLQGREAGTRYARKAAEYIARYWEEIGLDFLVNGSYFQYFIDDRPQHTNNFQNVIGVIRGNDPILRNEYIIVGAHFDHIGVIDGQIHNGADDNASGTAVLIELARMLKKNESDLKRSVIFAGFDAEEIGLIGSRHLAQTFDSIVPNGDIALMFSIDMVGWYAANGAVEYIGTGTIRNGCALILNEQLVPYGLNVEARRFERGILRATDTQPFAVRGIPTLHVFTGTESPFHQPEDEAHLIDLDGMVLITEHLYNIIKFVAQDTQNVASSRVARIHRPQPRVQFGVSANIGNNFHHYTAGAVIGKNAFSFGAGLMTQINFGNFGVRPEVHFDRIRAQFPGGHIATDNITIPLNCVVLQAQVAPRPGMNLATFDVVFGGYYTHRFNGTMGGEAMDFENTFNREEWGLTWGLGFHLRPFRTRVGFTNRSSLTNLMQSRNADNASLRNRTNYFTMTFIL
jgi:hypothetical protein